MEATLNNQTLLTAFGSLVVGMIVVLIGRWTSSYFQNKDERIDQNESEIRVLSNEVSALKSEMGKAIAQMNGKIDVMSKSLDHHFVNINKLEGKVEEGSRIMTEYIGQMKVIDTELKSFLKNRELRR